MFLQTTSPTKIHFCKHYKNIFLHSNLFFFTLSLQNPSGNETIKLCDLFEHLSVYILFCIGFDFDMRQ